MTDRELLELAAKAAGVDARRLAHAWPDRFDDEQWNPLTDDGDALRLAVRLEFVVDSNGMWTRVSFPFASESIVREQHMNDPYSATRRAIVRAAAEIGRKM